MGKEAQSRSNHSSTSSSAGWRSPFDPRPFGKEADLPARSPYGPKPFPIDDTVEEEAQTNAVPPYDYNFVMMPMSAPKAAAPPAPIQAKLSAERSDEPSEQKADRMADQGSSFSFLGIPMSAPKAAVPPAPVQAKLSAEQSNGQDEQETDQAYELATAMPEAAGQSYLQPTAEVPRDELEEETIQQRSLKNETLPPIQRRETDSLNNALPEIREGGGEPLQIEHRDAFSEALDQPLNDVRVHTDDAADQTARKLNAEAFTVKSDIYFANGFYAPGTPEGDRVLSHELIHVAQHQQGQVPSVSKSEDAVSKPTDPLEAEAYAQESVVAQEARQVRGDGDSSVLVASRTPPALAPEERTENTEGKKTASSDLSLDKDSKDDELIPEVPEQPSPFAVSETASPKSAISEIAPVETPPIPEATTQTQTPPPVGQASVTEPSTIEQTTANIAPVSPNVTIPSGETGAPIEPANVAKVDSVDLSGQSEQGAPQSVTRARRTGESTRAARTGRSST